MYYATHTRAAPWAIGILLGTYMQHDKLIMGTKMNKVVQTVI